MKILVALLSVAVVAQALNAGEPRIGGGGEATPGQFPYQVGIHLSLKGSGYKFCGGSILSEEWIITAAHCVDIAETIEIIVGAENIAVAQQFAVSPAGVIIHDAWDRSSFSNDVALIRLSEKLQLSQRVQPIRLPRRSQYFNTFANENGIISGWGQVSNVGDALSSVLHWARELIITNDDCKKDYPGSTLDAQICLTGSGYHSPCAGDYGGPMAVVDTDGEFTLVGVASMQRGFKCPSGWATVFTRVTSYLDWIETSTGGAIVIRD